MKKSRFSETQIVGILKEVELGAKVGETCRKHGVSEPTYVIVRRRPSLTACGFQASTICRSRLNATRQLCPSQSRVAVC